MHIAGKIGSDVPFCLYGHPARCTGRGEILSPRRLPFPIPALIVFGGEKMSTPAAYRLLDERYRDFTGEAELADASAPLMDAHLKDGSLEGIAGKMHNTFEATVLPFCPAAVETRRRLLSLGAVAAQMSGSGPSIFALFPTEEMAKRAQMAFGDRAYLTALLP